MLTEGWMDYLKIMGGLASILCAFHFSRLHGTTLFRRIGYFIYYVPALGFVAGLMIFVVLPVLILCSPLIVYREFMKRPGEITNQGDKAASRYIPANVKYKVWKRDNGTCQHDGCNAFLDIRFGPATILTNLHFDHITPYSKGGATTVNNLQLLCAKHNWKKGAN